MTVRIGNVLLLESEEDQICTMCGEMAECRPYGPGYTEVCFDCGMQDEEGATARFLHMMFDDPDPEAV